MPGLSSISQRSEACAMGRNEKEDDISSSNGGLIPIGLGLGLSPRFYANHANLAS